MNLTATTPVRITRLPAKLLLIAAVLAWTWWAFTTEFRAKPGVPARAAAFCVAFLGWYLGWGFWLKLSRRDEEPADPLDTPQARLARRLERERGRG